MKKLLYISEHKFLIDNCGKLYTTSDATNVYFDRYRNICDKIILVASAQKTNITDLENKSSISEIKNDDGFFEFHICEAEKPTTFVSRGIKIKPLIKNQIKKCDAIVMKVPSVSANTALRLAKKLNKPLMFEMVGCPFGPLWNYGNIQGKILAPIMYLKTKSAVKKAPFVLYVSRRFLQDKYKTNGQNVGCPDVILDTPSEQTLDNRLKLIETIKCRKTFNIGMFGYLDVEYRGHDTAIRMLFELKNRGISAKLKILGAGDADKWKSLADNLGLCEDVEFCGSLPTGEPVLNWIDKIDLLVMPTKQETLGRFIVEAMSRGCPVLGSIETAIGEQIGSDCLFKADDYNTLANMVEAMLSDDEYMKYCAQENFYRSFKYTNKQTDKIRNAFYKKFIESIER